MGIWSNLGNQNATKILEYFGAQFCTPILETKIVPQFWQPKLVANFGIWNWTRIYPNLGNRDRTTILATKAGPQIWQPIFDPNFCKQSWIQILASEIRPQFWDQFCTPIFGTKIEPQFWQQKSNRNLGPNFGNRKSGPDFLTGNRCPIS